MLKPQLSRQEAKVMDALAHGRSRKEIKDIIKTNRIGTVWMTIHRAKTRLEARTIEEAVAIWVREHEETYRLNNLPEPPNGEWEDE